MKRILGLIFVSLVIIFGLSATESFGQSKSKKWGVNNRQQNQQKRIVRGVKSGELTYRETYKLGREQYQIRRMEDRFRDSGDGLSWKERFKLEREIDQASRNIYKQKHDEQDYDKKKP